MADELKIFQAGEKITADETNDNNRYLLGLVQSAAGELQSYIDSQLNQYMTDLNSQISSLNTQIGAVSAVANSKLSATKGGNWVKFSNGLILQWGYDGNMGNRTVKKITLPQPYSLTYIVAGASTYEQTRGDKGATWRAFDTPNMSWFHLGSAFEQWNAGVFWFAIGF